MHLSEHDSAPGRPPWERGSTAATGGASSFPPSLPPSVPACLLEPELHSSPVLLSIHTEGAAGERAPPLRQLPQWNDPKFWNLNGREPWRGYLPGGSPEAVSSEKTPSGAGRVCVDSGYFGSVLQTSSGSTRCGEFHRPGLFSLPSPVTPCLPPLSATATPLPTLPNHLSHLRVAGMNSNRAQTHKPRTRLRAAVCFSAVGMCCSACVSVCARESVCLCATA